MKKFDLFRGYGLVHAVGEKNPKFKLVMGECYHVEKKFENLKMKKLKNSKQTFVLSITQNFIYETTLRALIKKFLAKFCIYYIIYSNF